MNETNALPHVSPMPDGPIDGPAAWLVSRNAMCGRPPVVKGFLNVDARAGRSCHVFGLFVRPCSMAAGHNALRGLGPGHKHALKGRSGTIGLSRSVGRLAWVRYSFIALSNFVGGSSPPVRVAALYRGQPRWLKLFASRHHGPGDAGDLVGQGDGGDLGGSPAQEPDQPGMARIAHLLGAPDHRQGTDDEQLSQVSITRFRDTAEAFLAARGVLFRHQPDPGTQVAA